MNRIDIGGLYKTSANIKINRQESRGGQDTH